MKVEELIKELTKFKQDEEVHGLEMGGGEIVTAIINYDAIGQHTTYPTILIGKR
jgi:hypothetical protein|tara:strand:- start:11535 stop:11696 length:162 start_codon:yes stop_codon:yes gene_type:complete